MKPIQHNPSCFQFTCTCGTVLTFALNSKTYTKLIGMKEVAPHVFVGDCPDCGQKHWRGTTYVDGQERSANRKGAA